jgi:hypothetical protein
LSESVVAATQQFWERRAGQQVSRGDASEAVRNVRAFLDLLARWDDDARTSLAGQRAGEAKGEEGGGR